MKQLRIEDGRDADPQKEAEKIARWLMDSVEAETATLAVRKAAALLQHLCPRALSGGTEDGYRIMAVREGAFYRLPDPHNEIVHSDYLTGIDRVEWCSIEQKWLA